MTGLLLGGGFLRGAAWGLTLPVAVMALLVAAEVAVTRRIDHRRALLVLFAPALGAWRGERPEPVVVAPWMSSVDAVSGRVETQPAAGTSQQRFFLRVERVGIKGASQEASFRLWVSAPLWSGGSGLAGRASAACER